MRCIICKQGETKPGLATVTLERDDLTIVFKRVPAQVCANCGEEYVDEPAAAGLLETAEEMARAGTQVEIRQYLAS